MVDHGVFEPYELQGPVTLLFIVKFPVNNRVDLTLVVGVHERGYTLRRHYELIQFIPCFVQVLTRLVEILAETLSDKRQKTPVTHLVKE